MSSGIYVIENKINGHRYVGSAVNLKSRWAVHRCMLRKGTHHSQYLQRAWDKYGKAAFKFEVLERWEPEFLIGMEQWWMNMLQPEYNINPVAGNCLGMKHTAEARANMSAAQKGSTASPETRARQSKALKGKRKGYKHTAEAKAKMSAALKGRKNGPCSEETKAKISAANKGRKFSDDHKAKLSEAMNGRIPSNKGIPMSEKQNEKLSAANKGQAAWNKGVPMSEEQKAKLSDANKGRTHSEATKAKISSAIRGYKHTAEARANMSAAQRAMGISEEHRAKINAGQKKRRKLARPQIHEIRRLLALGNMSQKEIAKHYPVGRGTIRKISAGQLYTDW